MDATHRHLIKKLIAVVSLFVISMIFLSYAIIKTIEKKRLQPSPQRLKELDSHIKNGFTLVELMVSISIISILASFVMINLGMVREKLRDDSRISNLQMLQIALESYKSDNGEYPKTFDPSFSPTPPNYNVPAFSECWTIGGEYIPGLIPKYIYKMPSDPRLVCNLEAPTHSWMYMSNGIDYKLLTHNENTKRHKEFIDPRWDNGTDPCEIDGQSVWHYTVYTPGASCWSPIP